jgi:hypothetical protein
MTRGGTNHGTPGSGLTFGDTPFEFVTNISLQKCHGCPTTPPLTVPGPVVGAGLPGLILGRWWSARLVETASESCLNKQN